MKKVLEAAELVEWLVAAMAIVSLGMTSLICINNYIRPHAILVLQSHHED